MCVYTCMWVRKLVCACTGQKRALSVSLLGFDNFFKAGSFPEPGALVFTAKVKKASKPSHPSLSVLFLCKSKPHGWSGKRLGGFGRRAGRKYFKEHTFVKAPPWRDPGLPVNSFTFAQQVWLIKGKVQSKLYASFLASLKEEALSGEGWAASVSAWHLSL